MRLKPASVILATAGGFVCWVPPIHLVLCVLCKRKCGPDDRHSCSRDFLCRQTVQKCIIMELCPQDFYRSNAVAWQESYKLPLGRAQQEAYRAEAVVAGLFISTEEGLMLVCSNLIAEEVEQSMRRDSSDAGCNHAILAAELEV